jgi:hypothetical protein
MTILVKIYGDLITKIDPNIHTISKPLNINLHFENDLKVSNILNKLGMTIDETSHIYVNNIYSGMEKKVKSGDRVGIFPRKHGILFKEFNMYFIST